MQIFFIDAYTKIHNLFFRSVNWFKFIYLFIVFSFLLNGNLFPGFITTSYSNKKCSKNWFQHIGSANIVENILFHGSIYTLIP